MSKIQAIIHAARLRTLPLSVASSITSAGIATYLGVFDWSIFLFTITVVILLQTLSNFSNDLGDSQKGTDNANRVGPKRAVQSGIISVEEMKKLIQFIVILTILLGILLLYVARILWWERWILFTIGLCAVFAAISYTQGRLSYGYRGFGDLFVLIFFGLIGVIGSLYLSIHHFNNAALLPAFGVGLLSVGVLHLNNMRDRVNDNQSHKKTLAVRMGKENSKIYFLVIIIFAIILWASYVFTQNNVNIYSYLYWLGFLPLIWVFIKFFQVKQDSEYDRLLKPVALITFLISILFFLSQLL